jgi:hypothetical protein
MTWSKARVPDLVPEIERHRNRGTKEILGASILGVRGDEAIHSILDLMYAKAPIP